MCGTFVAAIVMVALSWSCVVWHRRHDVAAVSEPAPLPLPAVVPVPPPASDAGIAVVELDAAPADAAEPVLAAPEHRIVGYRDVPIRQVAIGAGAEWSRGAYSDPGFGVGVEVRCPAGARVHVRIVDARGRSWPATRTSPDVLRVRRDDLDGEFEVKLRNVGASEVRCDLLVHARLAVDP